MKSKICCFATIACLVLSTGFAASVSGQSIKASSDFGHAKRLYENGLYDAAIGLFSDFQEHHPDDPSASIAQFLIGEAYMKLGDFENALMAYKIYTSRYFNGEQLADAWFRRAECLEALGRNKTAAETYVAAAENLFESKKYAGLGLYRAAGIYKKLKDYEKALSVLSRLIDSYPGHDLYFRAILLFSNIYAETGDYNRAVRELEKIEFSRAGNPVKWEAAYYNGIYAFRLKNMAAGEAALKSVIAAAPADSSVYRKSALVLGDYFYTFNRLQDAVQILNPLTTGSSDDLQTAGRAHLILGKFRYRNELYEEAIANLDAAAGLLTDDNHLREVWYYTGMAYRKLGNEQSAVEMFMKMYNEAWFAQEDAGPPESFEIDAFGNFIESARFANAPIDIGLFSNKILEKSAYFDTPDGHLQWARMFTEAGDLRTADALIESGLRRFPEEKTSGSLMLQKGKVKELQNSNAEAISVYKDIVNTFPGGRAARLAEVRAEYLGKKYSSYGVTDIQLKRSELSDLFFIELSGARQNTLTPAQNLRIASFYYDYLRDREKALEIYRRIIDGGSGAAYGEALYACAKIYDDLAFINEFEEDKAEASEARSSAVSYYQRYASEFGGTPEAVSARMRIADLTAAQMLANAEGIGQVVAVYDGLAADQVPVLAAYGTYKRAEAVFTSAEIPDSLRSFDSELFALDLSQLDRPLAGDIRYFQVKSAAGLPDKSTAIQLCTSYISDFPHGKYAPEIRFIGAQSLVASGNISEALLWINDLRDTFYYSEYADSVRVLLADILIGQERYEEALGLYQQEIAQLSVNGDSPRLRGLIRKTAHTNFLRKDFEQAADNYRLFITLSDTPEDQAAGYFGLAETLEAMQDHTSAVQAFVKTAELSPNMDLVTEAQERQAGILMQTENFTDAGDLYLALSKKDMPDSLKAQYEYLYLVNLYNRDRRRQANDERGEFERRYRDLPKYKMDEYIGALRVEEGNVHLRVPRFNDAESIFRDVIKDYRNSKAQQYAEYMLGIALLQQNKIDEGTNLLVNFDKKYPDSPYLHSVYYSYGTILKNAFEDFRGAYIQFSKAVETPEGIENIETHRNYIEVCELSGFREAAITAINTYLDHFPGADDRIIQQIRLGNLYKELERYDEAVIHFKALMRYAGPEDELEIQFNIGETYYLQGKYSLAIAEFLRIPMYGTTQTKLPWHSTAKYYIALCFEELGNYAQAIRYLDEVIKIEGSNERGSQAFLVKTRIEELMKRRK